MEDNTIGCFHLADVSVSIRHSNGMLLDMIATMVAYMHMTSNAHSVLSDILLWQSQSQYWFILECHPVSVACDLL